MSLFLKTVITISGAIHSLSFECDFVWLCGFSETMPSFGFYFLVFVGPQCNNATGMSRLCFLRPHGFCVFRCSEPLTHGRRHGFNAQMEDTTRCQQIGVGGQEQVHVARPHGPEMLRRGPAAIFVEFVSISLRSLFFGTTAVRPMLVFSRTVMPGYGVVVLDDCIIVIRQANHTDKLAQEESGVGPLVIELNRVSPSQTVSSLFHVRRLCGCRPWCCWFGKPGSLYYRSMDRVFSSTIGSRSRMWKMLRCGEYVLESRAWIFLTLRWWKKLLISLPGAHSTVHCGAGCWFSCATDRGRDLRGYAAAHRWTNCPGAALGLCCCSGPVSTWINVSPSMSVGYRKIVFRNRSRSRLRMLRPKNEKKQTQTVSCGRCTRWHDRLQ